MKYTVIKVRLVYFQKDTDSPWSKDNTFVINSKTYLSEKALEDFETWRKGKLAELPKHDHAMAFTWYVHRYIGGGTEQPNNFHREVGRKKKATKH